MNQLKDKKQGNGIEKAKESIYDGWKKRRTLFIFILLGSIVFLLAYINYNHRYLESQGYVSMKDILQEDGYKKVSENDTQLIFSKGEPEINLTVNLMEQKIQKNQYFYDIHNTWVKFSGKIYIHRDILEQVITRKIEKKGINYVLKDYENAPHEWTKKYQPLITHAAGGIVRKNATEIFEYTNSMEALVQNYNKGHRIFEIDLRLSTDEKILALHKWDDIGAEPMAAAEWKDYKIFGTLTTMTLEDVLREMTINKDIYIVTDTKSYEYSKEEAQRQFQMLYDEIVAYDPSLLHRIIPQMYNREMYDMINDIYQWPSIIYTLYYTEDTNQEAVDFVRDKENIKVVTFPQERVEEGFIQGLKEYGKISYIHTFNNFDDLKKWMDYGVEGFYTDYITPRAFEEWYYEK